MIREMTENDIECIVDILHKEVKDINKSDVKTRIYLEASNCLVYEENNKVIGFCAFTFYENSTNGDFILYVSESHRNNSIGTILYNKILENIKIKHTSISTIITEIRTEKYDSSNFFISKQFVNWFGYQHMVYRSEKIFSNLKLINYNKIHYKEYCAIYNDCFYDMRFALGLKPYACCQSASELYNNKDNIFLLLNQKEIIGSITLIDNEIDDLIVNKKYQSKGYGRELIKFGINYYQDKNIDNIFLKVATWNKKALHLYTKLGFTKEISGEFLRLNL